MARAAVAFVHKAKGEPSPITDDVLEVLRGLSASKAAERGRGQARGITRDDFAVILARAGEPRKLGRGMETAETDAAGVEGVTAHSGRVGLASELTAAGASTTETMLAGGWKTSRMVAHYSAGASAERGTVAKYL